jgi:DNA-binding NtrC family response regulator
MLGSSPQAQFLQKVVEQAAPTSLPVLISGERGVGREFLARTLHEQGGRAGRFIRVNCSGLAERVLESALSSAVIDAQAGTLFVDSIEEASSNAQAHLAERVQLSNVRVIGATTGSNFDDRIVPGLFGLRIVIAPLRERRPDVPVMIDHFIREFARQHGKRVRGIHGATLKKLMTYHWPGNIRELRDAVERAVVTTVHDMLDLDDFAFLVTAGEERPLQFMIPGATIQEIEKEAILRTLEHAGGSTTSAARILNMSVRKIQYKLKQYRIAAEPTIPAKAKAKAAGD